MSAMVGTGPNIAEVNIKKDEQGYSLSPDTTGLEIALRLNHLISADSRAKRERIEEQSRRDIERLLVFLPAVNEIVPVTKISLEKLQQILAMEQSSFGTPDHEEYREVQRLIEETRYLLARIQDATVRSQEVIFKLATSATTAARESRYRLAAELKQFVEFFGEMSFRCLSAFEMAQVRTRDPKLKSMTAEPIMRLRTLIELTRSMNIEEIADGLYLAQEKARQARTALANRDSRVKAVLNSIYKSQGQEPSIVDVKIGTDIKKLQKWLDDVFAMFVASRPKQRIEVLQKTYKKEWDIFTRSSLYPALSLSDSTSVHELKLQEYFNLSNKWSAQRVTLNQLGSLREVRTRSDFTHTSGAQLDVRRKARDLMKTRLNPSDSLSFVFTFPPAMSSRMDELEFKLLNASRTIPNVGKVEVSSRTLPSRQCELSIEFPATDSFEAVEKLKQLMISVVDPFLD